MMKESKDGQRSAYIFRKQGPRRPYWEVSMHVRDSFDPDDHRIFQTTSLKSAVYEARAHTGRETDKQVTERIIHAMDRGR